MDIGRVLVIEDDADIARIMHLTLRDMGATAVVLEANGTDGLARGLAEPFDLVLLDLLMPGRDGYDVARTLRAEMCRETLIIFVTGASRKVDPRVVRRSGADGLIHKPFSAVRLVSEIERIKGIRAQRDADPNFRDPGSTMDEF